MGLGIEPSVLVPWFAVTAELLGDVIRLAWHWHEVDRRREAAAHAAAGAVGADSIHLDSVGQPRQGGFPREIADRLGLADWALCRLSQMMDRQVAAGRQQGPLPASQGVVHGSNSSSSLQELLAGAAGGGGQVDMGASMEALAVRMLRPAHSVDELFVVMRERREHLLSGGCGCIVGGWLSCAASCVMTSTTWVCYAGVSIGELLYGQLLVGG